MRNINVFAEDTGHEKVLVSLVQRFAVQYGVSTKINIENAAGGHGKVIFTLKQYVRDLGRGRKSFSDLLIRICRSFGQRYEFRETGTDRGITWQAPQRIAI